MVSFELSKDLEKGVFHLDMSVGQRKNYVGSREESNLRPSDSTLPYSETEPQRHYGERGPLWSSCMTPILHTVRISDVDSVIFVNRIREVVGFELPERFVSSFHECGTKKKVFFCISYSNI